MPRAENQLQQNRRPKLRSTKNQTIEVRSSHNRTSQYKNTNRIIQSGSNWTQRLVPRMPSRIEIATGKRRSNQYQVKSSPNSMEVDRTCKPNHRTPLPQSDLLIDMLIQMKLSCFGSTRRIRWKDLAMAKEETLWRHLILKMHHQILTLWTKWP